ncbi:hypothetical protein AB0M34_00985, partial [Nocardia sp. NPDC050193]
NARLGYPSRAPRYALVHHQLTAVLRRPPESASWRALSRELLASILLDSGVPVSGRGVRAPASAVTVEEPIPGL